jgi:DNA-nicking Smr family endonuclease
MQMKKKSFEVHDRNSGMRLPAPQGPWESALKMSAASVSCQSRAVQILPQKASAPKIPLNKSPPPITGFDRRTEQKLMRGKVEIESRLDLYGMGLEEAYASY